METVAFCEFDKHARKVLAKHWPNVPIHNDVRELDGKEYRGSVDVVCGGFPCQDLSVAGKKAGFDGERSSLYREMLRIISECMPRYAIFENVTGLLTGESGRWFGQFLYDLAAIGYDAEWHCIPASQLGAHHHRDRIWIIAYPDNNGQLTAEIERGINERGGNKEGEDPAEQFEGCSKLCGGEVLADTASGESRREEFGRMEPNFRAGSEGKTIFPDTDSKRGRRRHSRRENAKNARESPIGKRINTGRVEEWDVESALGGRLNGFPYWMDRHIGKGMSQDESKRAAKELHSLWCCNVSKTLFRATGGLERVEKAEVLFFVLREYEKGTDEAWLLLEGEEVSGKYLRSLWMYGKSTGASYRPEYKEQYEREYTNSMQEVSRFLAQHGKEDWTLSSWEDGLPRVANGIPNRSHRLKQLGNAVVPQIPEAIGRAIMEYEKINSERVG